LTLYQQVTTRKTLTWKHGTRLGVL